MKKILFVAIAATFLAAGCQKTEVINRVGDKIDFATDLSKLTKAAGEESNAEKEGMQNLRAQNFRVWAYYVAADENTGAAAKSVYDGMADSPVTHSYKDAEKKEGDVWAPNNDYYWPGKGKDLMFFAVSGVEENAVEVNIEECTLETEFTVDPDAADTDLMVADFIQQNQGDKVDDATGKVAFEFNHALSKVEFKFTKAEGTSERIFVQSLVVGTEGENESVEGGLINIGTLTASTESENFGKERTEGTEKIQHTVKLNWDTKDSKQVVFKDDWTEKVKKDAGYPSEYQDIKGDKVEVSEDGEEAMEVVDNENKTFTTWLMVPQNIYDKEKKEGKTVTITYLIDNRQFKVIFPLYVEDKLTDWSVNQYVRYNVTLSPNKITFGASVNPWKEGNVNLDESKADYVEVDEQNGGTTNGGTEGNA